MLGHDFDHNILRKYVIWFGTLFNDINLYRTDDVGGPVNKIRVPISYAPKDKLLARIAADPEIQRQAAVVLPRMAFQYTGFNYDGQRKLPTLNKIVVKNADPNKASYQFMPVPYNIEFELYVYAKNAVDGTKIIGQILPFFTPDFTAQLELIPATKTFMDIPVSIGAMSCQDSYDDQFLNRRAIIWTLNFTLKGYFYGPIYSAPIVKFANTNYFIGSREESQVPGSESLNEYVNIVPGLTANGEPTSNSALSINTNLIEEDDDFGYIITQSGLIIQEQ